MLRQTSRQHWGVGSSSGIENLTDAEWEALLLHKYDGEEVTPLPWADPQYIDCTDFTVGAPIPGPEGGFANAAWELVRSQFLILLSPEPLQASVLGPRPPRGGGGTGGSFSDIFPAVPESAREGIVSWWPGDGHYNDMYGGNVAFPAYGVTFAEGIFDSAFAFPGPFGPPPANPYTMAGGVGINDLEQLSISTWLKLNSIPTDIQRFVTIAPPTIESAVLRHDGTNNPHTSNQLHFYMRIDGSFQDIRVNDVLQTGCFHHIAGTYDGSHLRLYLDGAEVGYLNYTGTVDDGDSVRFSSPDEPLDGLLDEVMIFDKALDPAEVEAIYDAGDEGLKCGPLFEFTSVSVGGLHQCALGQADDAYCWGYNAWWGAIGDGTTTNRLRPVAVSGGHNFVQISARRSHTCALTDLGAAYCWGFNLSGKLGDGSTTNRDIPTAVSTSETFARVISGRSHTCALTSAGVAYCWGDNYYGQLGDGTTTSRHTPVAVQTDSTFTHLALGDGHTCGVTPSGRAFCWGSNLGGELGTATGETCGPYDDPCSTTLLYVAMPGEPHAAWDSLAAGFAVTCGTATDDTAYCWGNNANGQLGDGTTTDRHTPVAISGTATFSSISVGTSQTCGLTDSGIAYCWGYNGSGQLGDGTTTDRHTPTPVVGGLVFQSIGAGVTATCGLSTGNAVYCWGDNAVGQLGNGTASGSSIPVRVSSPQP
jgi:alpha-tubulin suppressor-like RCC1 family protein